MSGAVRGRSVIECNDFFDIFRCECGDPLLSYDLCDPVEDMDPDRYREFRTTAGTLVSYIRTHEGWALNSARSRFHYDRKSPYRGYFLSSPVTDDRTVIYTGERFHRKLGIWFQPNNRKIQKSLRLDAFLSCLYEYAGQSAQDMTLLVHQIILDTRKAAEQDALQADLQIDALQNTVYGLIKDLLEKAARQQYDLPRKLYSLIFGENDLFLVRLKNGICSLGILNAGFDMQEKSTLLNLQSRYIGFRQSTPTTALVYFENSDGSTPISFTVNLNLRNVIKAVPHAYVYLSTSLQEIPLPPC